MLLVRDGTVFDFSAPGIVPDNGCIQVCQVTGYRCNVVAPSCDKECPVLHQTARFVLVPVPSGDDGPG